MNPDPAGPIMGLETKGDEPGPDMISCWEIGIPGPPAGKTNISTVLIAVVVVVVVGYISQSPKTMSYTLTHAGELEGWQNKVWNKDVQEERMRK